MRMIYYKEIETGEYYAYDEEQVSGGFVRKGLIQLNEQETFEHINKKSVLSLDDVTNNRRMEYANPLTGSDRWFAEAARLAAMSATQEEVDAAKQKGIARYNEIQLEHPWP